MILKKRRFLITIFSNKVWKSKKKNRTPLHWAAENNSKEIGKLLILKGANVNEVDIIYQCVIL